MESCQRCGEVDYDRRTLSMACFYEMNELGIPFEMAGDKGQFYTLRVCKECRGDWMSAIKSWFQDRKQSSPGTGIFVRRNGASVEITQEEWDALNPGRDPVRVKP